MSKFLGTSPSSTTFLQFVSGRRCLSSHATTLHHGTQHHYEKPEMHASNHCRLFADILTLLTGYAGGAHNYPNPFPYIPERVHHEPHPHSPYQPEPKPEPGHYEPEEPVYYASSSSELAYYPSAAPVYSASEPSYEPPTYSTPSYDPPTYSTPAAYAPPSVS